MSSGKNNNKKSLRAFSSGLVVALLLLVSTPAVSAWSVQGHWIDRANMEITKVEFDDGQDQKDFGYHLSTQAAQITEAAQKQGKDGNSELRRLVNKDAVGKYTDNDVADGEFFYNKTGCRSDYSVDAQGKDGIGSNKASYSITSIQITSDAVGTPLFGQCHRFTQETARTGDKVAEFKLDNPDNAHDIWFRAKDNKTLTRVDGRDGEFKVIEGKNPNMYYANTGGVCEDGLYQRVIIDAGQKGNTISGKYETCQKGGEYNGTISVKIGDANNMSKEGQASSPTNPPGGNGSTTTDGTPRCESGGLSWAICPIINGLAGASDLMFEKVVKPALQTDTISVAQSTPTEPNYIYQAWSTMRIYGNVLLVIGMLVIVFGQAIGGGLIDAYTAKKVLPRILAAAIMLNLSIYIVAILVDITNIIGNGINSLLSGLIVGGSAGAMNLQLNAGASAIGIASIVGAGGAIWALGATLVQPFLLFILLPLALALLAVVVTIILRKGLIMLLIITAPIAFALYCLPNTEQYFKKWWKLLFEALLVYPIIGAVFGIANLMAATINHANTSNGVTSAVAQLISIIVLIIPLFLIPYSFKLAGGVLGNLHGQLTGFGKKANQGILGDSHNPNSNRNRAKRNMGERFTHRREHAYDGIGDLQKKAAGTRLRNRMAVRGLGIAGAITGSGDLEARRSALNKQESEIRELKTGYGPDASVRALYATKRADGRWISTTDNKTEYAEQDVRKAQSLYGKNLSATQAAVNYEVGKAGDDEEYQNFLTGTPAMMEQFGHSKDDINSALKGVGFVNAAKRLDLKHSSFEKGEDGTWSRKLNMPKFTRDAAENFGSYPIANMKTSPIDALDYSYDQATTALAAGVFGEGEAFASREEAQQVKDDVESTARTLDTRMRRGDFGQVGATEDGQPISAGASGGPGRVNDKIQALVHKVLPQQQAPPPGLVLPGDPDFHR